MHGLMKNNEIILSIYIVSLEGLGFSTDRNPWEMPYSGTPSLISVPGINGGHRGYFTSIFLCKELSFLALNFKRPEYLHSNPFNSYFIESRSHCGS